MGYTSAESVRNLGNSWSIENDWRHTQPSIFNSTEYASRLKQGRRPSGSDAAVVRYHRSALTTWEE